MCTMRMVQNLQKNLFFVSKMTRIWWILIWALKSLKNLHFDWSLLCKVYNVWPKKVQRSIFHDTRVMQNLKKNWLVVWKMTWGIQQIFITTLENVQFSIFHGILLFKVENSWATNYMSYRGVISNDTEEWWKIWREIDLSFQNWHKEFD